MTRIRSIQLVLVLGTLVLTAGTAVGQTTPPDGTDIGEPLANQPWSFDAIAGITGGDVGKHASIAFNPGTGKPYISYYDETNGDLRLIYPHSTAGNCGPNNEWYCETVDSDDDVGQYSSIDYFHDDATGENKIGIAYYDATNDNLKAAIWSNTRFPGWTVSTVNANPPFGSTYNTGRYASLKFDSNGTAHIAYVDRYSFAGSSSYKVRHAYSVSSGGDCGEGAAAGKWQCDTVSSNDSNLPISTSLALTSTDEPNVAFFNEYLDAVSFCQKAAGAWSCERIESTGGIGAQVFVSLAVDQADLPHIAYYDHHNGKLKYATYVGSDGNCGLAGASNEYQCDILDTIGDSQSQVGISIAVDPDGYPIIAYQEDSDPMGFPYLNVARPALAHGSLTGNCGPIVNLFRRWQCTTIDDATQGGGAGSLYEADFTAVGVAPNGLASIAYYEIDGYNNEGRLKFAAQEIPGLLFGDGFETGNTYAWAEVVGGQ